MVASAFSSLNDVQSDFLAALPRITRHARCYFRHVCCRERKADLVNEVVALCWKWWIRLVEVGKNPAAFVSTLASFAARAVRAGRRVCGAERARDAMSPVAQYRHNFSVSKLPDFATESTNPLQDALTDNTQSPIPDQVQFRCDFPAWLTTHTHRNRQLIHEMAMNARTTDLANRFHLSQSRISQLRREFQDDWQQFTDDHSTARPAA